LIAVIAIALGARRVIRPLQQLETQAARAGQGDFSALGQPIGGIAEIQTLHTTMGRMADQIQRYQRSLQSYAAALSRSQEDERSRLARELHDETVQSLIALGHRVQMAERALRRDPQVAATKLAELREMTQTTLEEVRRVIRGLRPIYLEDLGLLPSIEMLAQSVGSEDNLDITLRIEGEAQRLAPVRELALFRIVQEALNNIVKHAGAKHVQIELKFMDALLVIVTDDGAGFTLPDRLDTLTDSNHFGLVGMRERAESIGARLTIRSAPGQGATIELRLPT
jgi:signal transduction histidine kinase